MILLNQLIKSILEMGNCIKMNRTLIECDNDIPYFDLKGNCYDAKVVDVYDGDTCNIVIMFNGHLTKFKMRSNGYDSPEMKPPKSDEMRDKIIDSAIKSRNYFISRITNCSIEIDKHYTKKEIKELLKLNTKVVKIFSVGWDKYGRLLGEIVVDKVNINSEMINKGYGYQYDGGKKENFI